MNATTADLRVHVVLPDLQRQFAAWLATPTRARGYPPRAGQHALLVEVAPGLAIHRIADLAMRAVPAAEPSILFVERQFGVLGLHADDPADIAAASAAIRAGLADQGADGLPGTPAEGLRPRVLYTDVIDDLRDAHAVIVNRTREGSMLLPGCSLLVVEVTPALFAAVARQRGRAPGAGHHPGRRVDHRVGRPALPVGHPATGARGRGRHRYCAVRRRRKGP